MYATFFYKNVKYEYVPVMMILTFSQIEESFFDSKNKLFVKIKLSLHEGQVFMSSFKRIVLSIKIRKHQQ